MHARGHVRFERLAERLGLSEALDGVSIARGCGFIAGWTDHVAFRRTPKAAPGAGRADAVGQGLQAGPVADRFPPAAD